MTEIIGTIILEILKQVAIPAIQKQFETQSCSRCSVRPMRFTLKCCQTPLCSICVGGMIERGSDMASRFRCAFCGETARVKPRLIVEMGARLGVEYVLNDGQNLIGRTNEAPVDIDLADQEPPDGTLCSRLHATITFQDGRLAIEDMKSMNGTFINAARIGPGQSFPLREGDIVQIGNVKLKVVIL